MSTTNGILNTINSYIKEKTGRTGERVTYMDLMMLCRSKDYSLDDLNGALDELKERGAIISHPRVFKKSIKFDEYEIAARPASENSSPFRF